MMKPLACFVALLLFVTPFCPADEPQRLSVGVFDVDASPPVGSLLAYDPVKDIQTPLKCKGVVIVGSDKPIVLCAVDWIGIGNASHLYFRETVAKAANTSADRVAVQTLHQHDAPWADFSIDELSIQHNAPYRPFDSAYARKAIQNVAAAVGDSLKALQLVTHVGFGTAIVEKVASNRRVLGPDGKVLHVRWSSVKDPIVRDFPEGVIDPSLKMISFWNKDKPVAAMSYYATHPQSYYRTGLANPDFPGLARNATESKIGVPLIHFNGAGGNVTAGKYNDGAHENRQVLADRVASAMERAWKDTKREPLSSKDVTWNSEGIVLPLASGLDKAALTTVLNDANQPPQARFVAATKLVWIQRTLANEPIPVGCLGLGKNRVLHLPGELFIEYQLAAQKLRTDLNVAMAAYGEYGPEYIGTAISYTQGGYETGPDASLVGPGSEAVIMQAIAKLLQANPADIKPL